MPAGQEDVARAFYRDLLGLSEVAKPPHLAVRGGCWFEINEVRLHLGVDPDFVPARKAHPGFVVDNLDALCSALQAAGYETAHAIRVKGKVALASTEAPGNPRSQGPPTPLRAAPQ